MDELRRVDECLRGDLAKREEESRGFGDWQDVVRRRSEMMNTDQLYVSAIYRISQMKS